MRHDHQRGIALVSVVVVLLVLTVLGITAAIMMTQEDRTARQMELQKAAFYVAEAGLRHGEQVLGGVTYSNITLNMLLNHASSVETPAASPKVPQQPPPWSAARLGAYLTTIPGAGAELSNVEVTGDFRLPGKDRAFYSLYVRNNEDDLGGATANNDSLIRLIAVGWIASPSGRVLAAKTLEEEFNFLGAAQSPSAQKLSDQGGTSSGIFTGN